MWGKDQNLQSIEDQLLTNRDVNYTRRTQSISRLYSRIYCGLHSDLHRQYQYRCSQQPWDICLCLLWSRDVHCHSWENPMVWGADLDGIYPTSQIYISKYQKLIGEIMFLCVNTSPDICYGLSVLSWLSPHHNMTFMTKHLLHYVWGRAPCW